MVPHAARVSSASLLFGFRRELRPTISLHSTAIANTLCVAWATNSYLGANTSAQNSSSGKL
jgi:hypothetical protein